MFLWIYMELDHMESLPWSPTGLVFFLLYEPIKSLEEEWHVLRDAACSVTKDVVGVVTHKHQDWFGDNYPRIQELLDTKHKLHKAHLSDKESESKKKAAYDNAKQTVQNELREMEDQSFCRKSEEIDRNACRHLQHERPLQNIKCSLRPSTNTYITSPNERWWKGANHR